MRFQRIAVVIALAMIIAAIPVSNAVLAQIKNETTICHFPDGKSEGHIIDVGLAAVDTHLKMHGDYLVFEKPKGGKVCVRNCEIQKCGKGEVWDPKKCQCVPGDLPCKQPEECPKGEVWDPIKCRCVKDDPKQCEPIKCPPGEVQDPKSCKCVPGKQEEK